MDTVFLLLLGISLLCVPIFIIWAIINLILRRPAKKRFAFAGMSALAFVISTIGFALTADDPASDSTVSMTNKAPLTTTENPLSQSISTSEDISVQPEYEDGSPKKELQDYAVNIIIENYNSTEIDSLSINDALGTDEPDDYIILVNLIWNAKNSASTSKDVLELYSEDFAAQIGRDQSSVKEIAIFWTIPYLNNATAKWSYEREGDGMYLSDNMMDSIFNE